MHKLPHALGLAALTLGVVANRAIAHEDDPKILHRKVPVFSQGFRSSLPATNSTSSSLGTTLQGTTFNSSGVALLAWVPLNLIDGASSGNDCWGYVSGTGREIAIMGTSSGTAFFDLSDPGNPLQIGYIDGPDSLWRDMKVFGNHCYIVSEGGNGIQVVDLSGVDSGQVTLVNTITSGGGLATHNVAINEDSGYLYRCGGGSSGLRIYNLNGNPASPTYVGQWSTKYVHDVQVVSYTTGPYAGKEIAFCCSGFNGGSVQTGLSIVDVTNKANPVVLSEAFYPNPAYSHQGWLSEDRTRFYLGDELDEDGSLTTRTHVINVTNLASPVVETFFTNGNAAIGHNMYSKDGLLYQANYTSGLRIFDYASNPLNPAEVGFFDTYGAGDGATFNGMWSTFPYFPSGLVICSDLESGFFVLYPGDAQLDIQVVGGVPEVWNPLGSVLEATITPASPGITVSGTASLVYDAGAGAVSLPMQSLGGNLYDVALPSLPCGTPVTWYIEAVASSGLTWTAPQNAPSNVYSSVLANGLTTLASFDMEATAGWVSGAAGDNATSGLWTRGDPNGSGAQPEDDHTALGASCWFTGQAAAGASIGTNDVDGGTTTLLTPVFDLSANTDPSIRYWRWYVNNGNGSADDSFFVDITANGTTWVNVETLAPGNTQASGGWFEQSVRVADFVTPTAQVRLRFRAVDVGNGSIVEAAIDDVRVSDLDCSGGSVSTFCDPGNTNSLGTPAILSATGSTTASDNNLTLQADLMPFNQFVYFVTGTQSVAPFVPSGSMGNLCLGGSLGRYNQAGQIGFTGSAGSFGLALNLQSMPTNPTQAALAGQTWYFQAWYRDVIGVSTSNFTNGVAVTFQ